MSMTRLQDAFSRLDQMAAGSRPTRPFRRQTPLDSFRRQQQAANRANESRYRDALRTNERMQENVRDFGRGEQVRMAQDARREFAATQQGLASRGLFNSTIVESMRGRVENNYQTRLMDLASRRSMMQNDVLGQRIGLMERRNDVGPDMGMLAQLMQQASFAQPTRYAGLPYGG